MTNAAQEKPGTATADGEAASDRGAVPEEIRNLPARIDAPLPPVPMERLHAEPEDAMERFAFALWAAGRKDEAVTFLKRQIARRKRARDAWAKPPADTSRASPMLLDFVPSPAVPLPPPPVPKRPFILTAALAVAIAVVWIGPENITLPDWMSSPRLALWTEPEVRPAATDPTEQAATALADAAGSVPAAAVSIASELAVIAAGEEARNDTPAAEPDRGARASLEAKGSEGEAFAVGPANAGSTAEPEVASARTEPATTGSTRALAPEDATISAEFPAPAADEPASEASPAPAVAAAFSISDLARRAGTAQATSAPQASSGKEAGSAEERSAPVTLQDLAATVLADPRLPRPRPSPSPEAVAAALAGPPSVSSRPGTRPEPRIVEAFPLLAEREVLPQRPRRLTIIGRVTRPGLAWRRMEAERLAAERRALAERRASIRRYHAPWGYPPSRYARRPLPWDYDDEPMYDPYEDDWRY